MSIVEQRRKRYQRDMLKARILALFIGNRLAARWYGFREHWVRDAKATGWSWL